MKRIKLKNEGFGPAHMAKSQPIGIAMDNLVCVVCGKKLNLAAGGWIVVSARKRKGIVAFAHESHASGAMNLLSDIAGTKKVPEDLKLPNESDN